MTDLHSEIEDGEAVLVIKQITVYANGEDIRKGRFITLTPTNTVWPPKAVEADSGEKVLGASMEAISDGKYGPVLVEGIIKMATGGVFGAGDPVKTDNEGLPVKSLAANDGLSGGRSYEHSTASGDKVLIFVCPDSHGIGT